MFKVILKNKNFSITSLSESLKRAGKRHEDFLRNYGVIFESSKLEKASSFSEAIFKDFGIETFVTDLSYPICKQPVEPDFFSLNMTTILSSKKELPISLLKAAVLASHRIFNIDRSIFRFKDSFEKTVSQNIISFFLLLDFETEILLLRPESLDYSAIFNEPSLSSMDNFRRLLSNLYSINPVIFNKTADLFTTYKDIQYFTYADGYDALKELSWLKVINEIETLI